VGEQTVGGVSGVGQGGGSGVHSGDGGSGGVDSGDGGSGVDSGDGSRVDGGGDSVSNVLGHNRGGRVGGVGGVVTACPTCWVTTGVAEWVV